MQERHGLPRLVVEGSGSGGVAELGIGAHVGQGGYAVVREGCQFAVGRHVAVKTLHNFDDDPEAVDALVREAKALGALDHPNIVPVHMLGSDVDGAPLIVMPLIKGVSWTELIDRHDHPFWDQHTGEARLATDRSDRLSAQLGILMKVANAAQHAHERGIVHCDIKPDNVMVGEYGQVYLIDWGLAVRSEELGPEALPWANTVDSPAGSPNYMAPEMAACEALTPQSDVYLLGGCLHEILTGDVPHPGGSMVEAISKIREVSDFAYDALLPRRLAEAARHALAYKPKHRYQTAAEFRQAVVAFLESRLGESWLDRAHRCLARLGEAVEVSGDKNNDKDDEGDDEVGAIEEERNRQVSPWAVHELYAETRYGLRQARTHGADDDLVRGALEECLELMTLYCIDRGDLGRAERLLQELGGPKARPALSKRLAERRSRRKRRSSMMIKALTAPDADRLSRAPWVAAVALLLGLLVVGVIAPQFGFSGLALPAGLALPLLLGLTQLELRQHPDPNSLRRRAGWHATPYIATLALAAAPATLLSDAAAMALLGVLLVSHFAVTAVAGGPRHSLLIAGATAAASAMAVLGDGPAALAALPLFAAATLGGAALRWRAGAPGASWG